MSIEVVVINSEDAARGAPPPPRNPFSDEHRVWEHYWAPVDPMEPDYTALGAEPVTSQRRDSAESAEGRAVQ